MKPLSVVILPGNGKAAESLAQSLHNHFRVVNLAGNLEELRHAIPRHAADVIIVDLERAGLEDVLELRKEFSSLSIVCTHRLADERMWMQALAVGAVDCCASTDVRAIVLAASHTGFVTHAHAA
jgi:DNA-binding NarL/FixJ family response regulator